MKKHLEIIKKCPLFFGIDDENLLRMLECLGARIMFFDKKHTIIEEGSPARNIGILLSGSVQIFQLDYYGNRSIIAELSAPEVFAEDFACAEADSVPVNIVADEPSYVMLIDCAHVLHTCSSSCDFHNQLIYNLMKDLAEKAILFHQRIEVTSKRTTREKLLTFLMIKSKEAGKKTFDIAFDRQELADYLEVDRSGLSAEISKLRSEGIIESKKNRFTLL